MLGRNLEVLPNNHGPQTDRLVYGLGPFSGYNCGDPTSRGAGPLRSVVRRHVHPRPVQRRAASSPGNSTIPISSTKRASSISSIWAAGISAASPARVAAIEDVFTGFNVFSIALEVPMTDIFPNGIPHNGTLKPNSTDSLLRVWIDITRRASRSWTRTTASPASGLRAFVQVGRNALPLFNAGLVGTQRQSLYLHTSPLKDVTNFGADVLFPVLVRDAEALGIYAALGVPPSSVTSLKGPRTDIIRAINLGRPIPIADGSTGDVLTLDVAVDSRFPNGRRLGGGLAPNRHQVNVNSVLISLIVAGDPARVWRRASKSTTRTSSTASRSSHPPTRDFCRGTEASTCRPSQLHRRRPDHRWSDRPSDGHALGRGHRTRQ